MKEMKELQEAVKNVGNATIIRIHVLMILTFYRLKDSQFRPILLETTSGTGKELSLDL
jgi:hypothetical protein